MILFTSRYLKSATKSSPAAGSLSIATRHPLAVVGNVDSGVALYALPIKPRVCDTALRRVFKTNKLPRGGYWF